MALAVRAGAGVGGDAAVRADAHARLLELAARALDVQRDAGPDHALGVGAALGLDELDREVHAALVVARVVAPAERRVVRERAHEVAAPQLERVDAQLARGLVDGQLEERGGLGAAGAAGRAGRDLVGARADRGHARGRDRVAAAHQHRGRVRRRRAVAEQVGAEVGEDARTDGEHAAVAVERQLDVGLHAAALVGGQEVLEPVLGPLDRPAEAQRRGGRRRDLRRGHALGAERAADVGQPHADARPERRREARERPVRVLRGDPDGQPVAVGLGDDAARLHRHRGHARDRVVGAHDVRGGGERALDVAGSSARTAAARAPRAGRPPRRAGRTRPRRARRRPRPARATRPAPARRPGRRSGPRRPRAAGAERRGAPRPAAPPAAAARRSRPP